MRRPLHAMFACALVALAWCCVLPGAARADQQRDPELKALLQKIIGSSDCFADKFESEVWYKTMEPRLARLVPTHDARVEILDHVYCEAKRDPSLQLPPDLVLALIEVESRFDRWAVSPAGAVGLIITTDWSFSSGRDWGSPKIPEKMDLRAMLRFAPEGITRPRWLLDFAKTGKVPDLTAPNLADAGGPAPTFFTAYGEWMQTPLPTWDDIAWLREQWGGPFMLKGVMRVDDARRAVDAGVTAISVSNHGGNNLDGTPAPIRALPAIVDAVGGRVEIVLDGGIRRGSDVVKALALGARAVMLGRAYLWGLAAGGQAGVENVLDIMRGGIDSALLGLGHSSVHDLSPADLVIPDGFRRELGA